MEQKDNHEKCSRKLLKTYTNCQNKRIYKLLNVDVTWIYYFEPQQKVNNKLWISKYWNRPGIAKISQSTKKVLYAFLFISKGHAVLHQKIFCYWQVWLKQGVKESEKKKITSNNIKGLAYLTSV